VNRPGLGGGRRAIGAADGDDVGDGDDGGDRDGVAVGSGLEATVGARDGGSDGVGVRASIGAAVGLGVASGPGLGLPVSRVGLVWDPPRCDGGVELCCWAPTDDDAHAAHSDTTTSSESTR
jgi:hypothetical protein